MDFNKVDIAEYLSKLTKSELIIIAKKYNKQLIKLNKQQLINELLKIEPRTNLLKILKITWWDRWHNHVYGIGGLLGTLVTILTILFPLGKYYNDKSNIVVMKVSIMPMDDALKYSEDSDNLRVSYETFWYSDSLIDGTTYVTPKNLYLDRYYKQKQVVIESYPWWEWIINPHNPIIDIKIANNTNNTLFADKIIAEIDTSRFDDRYLLLIYRELENTSSFLIVNESWRQWEYFDFNFSFIKNATDTISKPYKYHKRVYSFDFLYTFDLKPFLKKEGVDYDGIFKISQFYSDFVYDDPDTNLKVEDNTYLHIKDSTIVNEINSILPYIVNKADLDRGYIESAPFVNIIGEISFPDYNDTIKVSGIIPLTYEDGGAIITPCDSYNMMLKTEGVNYTVEVPISLAIKPHEVERVSVQLNAPKSSFHKLRFRLDGIDNTQIKSNNIYLELYKQRSMVKKER